MAETKRKTPSPVSFADVAFPQRLPEKEYTSSKEYFKDLETWLNQAYFWYGVTAAFPYYLLCKQVTTNPNDETQPNQQGFPSFMFPFPNAQNGAQEQNGQNDEEPVLDGIECRIPPLWKRVAAESIDFLILFFLKLAMTFIAVDFFDLVDLDKFDFDTFPKTAKLEYKVFLQMTHDIIILELVHRIVVCFFEAFWLQGGVGGRPGGATPGKSMMGLRVVRCESSLGIGEGLVVIRPGTDLGLTVSFARALLKNVIMTFLIPAGFAFLYFRHNRTGYDMVCGTIVVEEPLIPHRRHHE